MERFVSDPLPLSPRIASGDFNLAQLAFYGVDHSGSSFRALAFLNAPDADLGAPRGEDSDYAGSFTIFGHGGCSGEEGHCHVPDHQKDPFDSRPLHGLTPQTKLIDITTALKRVFANPEAERGHLRVTVVPVVSGEPDESSDVLFFSAMRFIAFD